MTESGKIPALNEIWSHFELGGLTKLVSVLAIFAYGTGVIAINMYLHGLGIVDFSFAKPKLLLTGILVLVTFLLLAFPPVFYAWSIAAGHYPKGRMPFLMRILIPLFGFFFVLLFSAAPLFFTGHPSMGQIAVWKVWAGIKPHDVPVKSLTAVIVAVGVYLPICFAAVSVYAATRLFGPTIEEQPARSISLRWVGLAFATAAFVVSAIGYICMFTLTFYSLIPQEFGGGEPYYQSFAVASEDACQLQELGIPFAQANITQLLPVVHETDTMVAVWLPLGGGKKGSGDWDFAVAELDKGQIHATKIGDKPEWPPSSSASQCPQPAAKN
jgi:hypothetical protein